MKTNFFRFLNAAFITGALLIGFTACSSDEDDEDLPPTGTVSGEITENTTWRGNVLMDGWIYVKNGASLTIEKGTVIKGLTGSKASLIIEKGAKIFAVGTAAEPIVFTSDKPAGQRAAGDWGGIIILGNATINPSGGDAEIEGGVGSHYGGSNDNDNSGKLMYVRIEFPGIPFEPNKEINGLTMGGVGSGTEIDFVQVSYSGDDSFEWFGGTVNAKHLIAFKGIDDDFDTDYGYRGMVQFGLVMRDANMADAAGDSNGFESDNDATGSSNSPFTQAIFSNISVFGPLATPETQISEKFNCGARLRRNTKLSVHNTFFTGWPYGLYIEGASTQANATSGALNIKNCVIAGNNNNFKDKTGEEFDEAGIFNSTNGCSILSSLNDLKIKNPYASSPNFLLNTNSPLLSGASFTGMNAFFSTTTYVGAFDGLTDWTTGWANFDPQNTVY